MDEPMEEFAQLIAMWVRFHDARPDVGLAWFLQHYKDGKLLAAAPVEPPVLGKEKTRHSPEGEAEKLAEPAHEPDECSVCNPELAADMSVRDEGYWEGWSDGQTVLRRDLMGILDLIEGPCANCKCEWCGGDHPDEECPRSPERHPVTGE